MKSFGILRTNVGLTTNVKVVVDGQYGLSLDSIDSAAELSASKYKKMSFNKENYYDELVPKFWGGLPAEIAYHIKYDDDSTSMTDNFASQYDEIYQYGARNIVNNKNYSEEFEYFAPLYAVRNKLPKNFIIFRVDGAGMIGLNRFNIRNEVFRNFKTVKVFDLSQKTALGEWLDKSINKNEFFPETPFNMSFTRLDFSNWNGIDYTTGGYISRSLFLEDVVEEEKEIFEMEKFVFDGYLKNKVIFPNILNFSFLFDDTPANSDALRKWSINRYYGFYLEDMERISTISPYITPFLKAGVTVNAGNILYSADGDPFEEGWSDAYPFYVEYSGEYYKVEKFTETLKKSVKPVSSGKSSVSQTATAQLEDIGASISTNVVSDSVTETISTRWRIISDIDLTGKESSLNKNFGQIDSDNFLRGYDQSYLEIDGFDMCDAWLIEIDGVYHNLVKKDEGIKICTDYSFKFYENYYEYWIYKSDTSYTKSVSFVVDQSNEPKKFSIYRLKFADIKDFDDRIVDTEYSKFEYEKSEELTETEEPKLYLTNLNSSVYPKELDDFRFKDKVVNIPVSSEYTANHETFKIYDNELSKIWRKNPVYCRWAYENSLSANDYPYPLNNSLKFGEYNRTTNTAIADPSRKERNLDYFYTVNSSTFSYLHHTLHVESNGVDGIDVDFGFDFEKYLGTSTFTDGANIATYSVDYFSYFFDRKTSFLSNEIKRNVKKYSLFAEGDTNTPNVSLFRGIKFLIYDVESIKKNNSGQIEKINLKTSNAFDDYKLSVLLTGEDNGMVWQVVDKWEMDKKYEKGRIVSHDDILYIANKETVTNAPIFNYLSSVSTKFVKSAPHAQSTYIQTDGYWGVTDTNNLPISYDWEFYTDDSSIMWNPVRAYSVGEIVYNHGDYYILANADSSFADFWNPVRAYHRGSDGIPYNENSFVIFNGEYYISSVDDNIYAPDNSKYWTKISAGQVGSKWTPVNMWNPGISYAANSYAIHNHIAYKSGARAIPAGDEPGKPNSLWQRIYGIEQETDFVYQPNSNPLIKMNNTLYLIKSNPSNSTLENGINIYINKKWKNILINISVNDNTISNISGTDRDSLYTSVNRKLTANNFIEAINNISSKQDFTDYVSYVVVDESGQRRYSYSGTGTSDIENLPHILFAERPEPIYVKVNSLDAKPVNISALKPSRVLSNGSISHSAELNYFNNTHIGTEIESNNDTPLVISNYNGVTNITSDTLYRFGGSYIPLFQDIDLFKRDNSISYNDMKITLEVSERQTVYFKYERDGISHENSYSINPGISYSTYANPIYGYYGQIIDIIKNEPFINDIEFKFDINKTNRFQNPTSEMSLHLDADLYNETSIWGDLGKYSNNVSISAIKHTNTNLYPGSYFGISDGIKTNKKMSFGENTTWEAWIKCGDIVNADNIFMGTSDTYLGMLNGNCISLKCDIGGQDKFLYSDTILKTKIWYHIACTAQYDGANTVLKIYIDAVENARATYAGSLTSLESDFFIGNSQTDPSTSFTGDISIVRIYERALGAEELMKNFVDQHNSLSIKYKSSVGDIKISLDRVYPTLAFNIIDLTGETTRTFQMGATGGSEPYQWSFNGGAFSTADSYIVSTSVTEYNIKVKDSIGLQGDAGYYTVNDFDGKTYISGTFSY